MNDEMRKIAKAQENIRIQLAPFSKATKAITESQTMMRVARDTNRLHELVRVAAGPIEEMRRQTR